MMYAVIETNNEVGHKEVCVVLSTWIKDGKVSWPTNYYKALKKMLNPDNSWAKHACVILKENLATYAEAKTKEIFLSEHSCSEIEDGAARQTQVFNFNDLFQNDRLTETNTCHEQPRNPSVATNVRVPNGEIKVAAPTDNTYILLEPAVNKSGPVSMSYEHNEFPSQSPVYLEQLNSINVSTHNPIVSDQINQQVIMEKLENIYSEIKKIKKYQKSQNVLIEEQNSKIAELKDDLAKTNTALEGFITSSICGTQKTKKILKCQDFIYPIVPIKSVQDLELVNGKLHESHYMDQMIIRMFKFRTANINKSVKHILEHLIDYNVIKLYSWTGQSGIAKGINKLIFSDLVMIKNLIENTLNYLNIDAPVTSDETRKAIQQFLKRSTIVMARNIEKRSTKT